MEDSDGAYREFSHHRHHLSFFKRTTHHRVRRRRQRELGANLDGAGLSPWRAWA
jgi:hypothetical protein